MQLLMDKLKIKLHSLVNSGPPVMPLSFKDRILDAGINNRFYNAQEFLVLNRTRQICNISYVVFAQSVHSSLI